MRCAAASFHLSFNTKCSFSVLLRRCPNFYPRSILCVIWTYRSMLLNNRGMLSQACGITD